MQGRIIAHGFLCVQAELKVIEVWGKGLVTTKDAKASHSPAHIWAEVQRAPGTPKRDPAVCLKVIEAYIAPNEEVGLQRWWHIGVGTACF